MEAVLSFRNKLNNCSSMLEKIALLKGEKIQSDEHARNNNIFFNAFNEYVKLATSCGVMKNFNAYIFSTQDLIELKKINKQIKDTFETKQTISPIILQNSIKRVNERLQATWNIFSDNLTKETLDQLEIFWLVCNNRKEIRDIINSIKGIKEWPLTEEKYKRYVQNIENANAQIKEVHFDEDIEVFLRKIKDRTATLLDLNDKILTWIRENNLNGNIMLAIKM